MTSRELVYEQTTPAGIVKPSPEELSVPEPRSGPAAAVVLAAGIGCFTLGLLSVLTAASGRISEALTLSERVGDVSGVTTATAVVFFAVWGALSLTWRRSDPPLMRVALASGALVVLGLLGTFPPFFNAIG